MPSVVCQRDVWAPKLQSNTNGTRYPSPRCQSDVWLVVRILTLTVATDRVRVLPCRLVENLSQRACTSYWNCGGMGRFAAESVDYTFSSFVLHWSSSTIDSQVSPRRHTISNARETLVCMIRLTFNCKVCVCQPSPTLVIASHISNRCSISAWTSHLLKIMP